MASDEFDVMSVEVALNDGDDNPLALRRAQGASAKSGAAVETSPESGCWVLCPTTSVATGMTVWIAVTASDRPPPPGGIGSAEEEKAL